MAKMWNKWSRTGTEMGSSTSRMIEKLSGIHPSVAKQAKTINPVRFWLSKGVNKITSFGVISAGSAAATKKKKQKKRVGRTILTEY